MGSRFPGNGTDRVKNSSVRRGPPAANPSLSGTIGGAIGRPVLNSTGPGSPTPMPYMHGGVFVGLELGEQLAGSPEGVLGTHLDVRVLVQLASQLSGQVGQCHADLGGTQLSEQNGADIRPEASSLGARPSWTGRGFLSSTSPLSINWMTRGATTLRPSPLSGPVPDVFWLARSG